MTSLAGGCETFSIGPVHKACAAIIMHCLTAALTVLRLLCSCVDLVSFSCEVAGNHIAGPACELMQVRGVGHHTVEGYRACLFVSLSS